MINHNFQLLSQFLSLTLTLLSLHLQFPTTTSNYDWYSTCSNSFNCGPSTIAAAGFPFWGGLRTESCGRPQLQLYCMRNAAMIDIMGVTYSISDIDEAAQTLRISRADFQDGLMCSLDRFTNDTALDPTVFEYAPGYEEITMLFDCSAPVSGAKIINCTNSGTRYLVRSVKGISESCASKLRFGSSAADYEELPSVSSPMAILFGSFDVKYKFDSDSCGRCERSGGVCGYDWYTNRNTCYCQNQTTWLSRSTCPSDSVIVSSLPKTDEHGDQ